MVHNKPYGWALFEFELRIRMNFQFEVQWEHVFTLINTFALTISKPFVSKI